MHLLLQSQPLKPIAKRGRMAYDEVMSTVSNVVPTSGFAEIVAGLLGRTADSISHVAGGGNSRIYRVNAGSRAFALKMYPTLAHDSRDRLGVEVRALRFLREQNITCVPEVHASCPGFALLDWVEGATVAEPSLEDIEQALDFLTRIRHASRKPGVSAFPAASEACLSGAEIMRQLQARLEKLLRAAVGEPQLMDFLERDFMPVLHAREQQARGRIDFATTLPPAHRCLIPADFGFHNALKRKNGGITFIDFEYFGWDDPVKLAADFLIHPAMRLTCPAKALFRQRMEEEFSQDGLFTARLAALLPLFFLRWTLILLNEFLPERWAGRAFVQATAPWQDAKTRQLAKAKIMLEECHA